MKPSRWWKHKWYSEERLLRSHWIRLRDPTNWHDGWTVADEEAAHYYRRLVAWYIGEARRWMREAREWENKANSFKWFAAKRIDSFWDKDEPLDNLSIDIWKAINEHFWELL